MKLKVLIRPEAAIDVLEAAKWYQKNLDGLGDRFLTSIDSAIDTLQQNPEAFPKVYKELRRILIKKFPFGIFYSIEKERIILFAVFHVSRNPRSWQKRTK